LKISWNIYRFIIDVVLTPFKLTWGVDGVSLIKQGIIVHDQ
jgi:hypothetical protein